MAFYRKLQQAINKLWYPQVIRVGRVDTRQIAQYISQGCTLTPGDIEAVLLSLPSAMAHYMSLGQSVKLTDIGTFYYTANTEGQGVSDPDNVSPEQITNLHVRFIPAGRRRSNNQYASRPLIADDIQWVEIQ